MPSPTTPISWRNWAGSGPRAAVSTGTRSGARRAATACPLPTYRFQRSRYFIEAKAPEARTADWLLRTEDREAWSWVPSWRPAYADCDVDVTGDLADASRETWLIFACDTGTTDAVTARLRAAGHDVVTVRPGDAFARLAPDAFCIAPERGRESYDQLLRQLTAEGRLPTRIVHGWLLTADEGHRPGSSFFHRVQEHGFWSLFHLAQAWAAEATGTPHLTVLTSDAMQVRSEPLRYPEKSTVLGPARVIPREFPGVTVAVLDLALRRGAPVDTGRILEELLAPPGNTTAAIRDGKRYALGVRQAPLPQDTLALKPGATVLLTGGFGGIGLTVAEALIRDHGARIALVARQPLPDRADWDADLARLAPSSATARRIHAIRHLEAAGGTVLTLAADVSNIEEMRAAKAGIEAALGPISGVVHAAGVIDDAPILAKSAAAIEDVFTPKIHGLQVLDALFPDGTLDWMALFSSTSTVTAPAGQVDYVAANAYLNAFAGSRGGGKTRVVAINWGLWAEVGMAADAMQARTGAAPTPEVALDAAMLDTAGFDADGARRFAARYAEARWFVDEHRTAAGDALIPGTGYLELAAEALAAQGEAMPYAIEDLHFLRPLRVDGTGAEVSVTLPRSDEGYDLRIESAAPGMAAEVNAEGRLNLLPLAPPPPLDLAAIAARMGPPEEGDLRSPQEAHLRFGPRWRTLRSRAYGAGEGLAHLTLPAVARADGAILHPALMDLATGWAMDLIDGYDGAHLWVPVSYGTVRVFAPLPARIVSHVRNAAPNAAHLATASFDVTLAAPDGTVLIEIEDFTIRRMEGAVRFAAPRAARPAGPRPLSPAEERLRHNLTQGIPPADGAALFLRALAAPHPQMIVTSLPLDALIAQAGATETRTESQTFERPHLDSDYVAPEGIVEERLAGFWKELLGVAEVGAEDSFFDLGGHSLIAVRLFAMVKKAFAVDFPISILFEAPTIRACAALIAERGVVDGDATAAPVAAPPRHRFTHLVPMHAGEGGPKTPFFLVAGMFGNVLNLRHLAHLIGTDRPFYGLQARGLYGDAAPHDDLVQAATDMIAEMRQVQAQGPWLVGGFSGGGITAYEIAQQLAAQGEEVAGVVMLDTPLAAAPPPQPRRPHGDPAAGVARGRCRLSVPLAREPCAVGGREASAKGRDRRDRRLSRHRHRGRVLRRHRALRGASLGRPAHPVPSAAAGQMAGGAGPLGQFRARLRPARQRLDRGRPRDRGHRGAGDARQHGPRAERARPCGAHEEGHRGGRAGRTAPRRAGGRRPLGRRQGRAMKVLTVILNWRTPDMTLRALDAARVAMQGVAGGIVVVDNDSGDGSFEAMRAHVADRGWQDVRVLQSGRNGGFGAGNNAGIRAGLPDGGRPDLIYVLNSDAFPAPDAIRVLHDHLAAHPAAGFAGSLIHDPDDGDAPGATHLTTFRFPGILSEFEGAARLGPVSRLLRRFAVPLPTPTQAGPVDWLAGASLMMRRSVLDDIGLFDETFFLYFEETDLCRRAARAGRAVHFVPESRVAHIGSVSTGMKHWVRVPDYWFASRWHYLVKNHGRFYAALVTLSHLKGGLLHRLRCLLTGRRPADPPQFLRTLAAHDARHLFATTPRPPVAQRTPT